MSLGHVHLIPEIYTEEEEIVDIISEGDKVVTRVISRGTSRGPFVGKPPTGRLVEISEASIYRMVD